MGKEGVDGPTNRRPSVALEPLAGEWTFEANLAQRRGWPGGGRVAFEGHASGAHLLQRGTTELPEPPDNVAIIGCDAANGTYFQVYSGERGVCRLLRDENRQRRVEALARGRVVLPALHAEL